jgi:hypothetical protein
MNRRLRACRQKKNAGNDLKRVGRRIKNAKKGAARYNRNSVT